MDYIHVLTRTELLNIFKMYKYRFVQVPPNCRGRGEKTNNPGSPGYVPSIFPDRPNLHRTAETTGRVVETWYLEKADSPENIDDDCHKGESVEEDSGVEKVTKILSLSESSGVLSKNPEIKPPPVSNDDGQGENIFNSKHCTRLFQKLWSMQQNGHLCDISITDGTSMVRAHQVVLATVSPYFAQFIHGDGGEIDSRMKEVVVEFPAGIVTQVIQYVYTGSIFLTQQTVDMMSGLFKKWQIEIGVKCCHHFKERVLLENNNSDVTPEKTNIPVDPPKEDSKLSVLKDSLKAATPEDKVHSKCRKEIPSDLPPDHSEHPLADSEPDPNSRIIGSAPSWIELFSVRTENDNAGFVNTAKEFEDVKWAYELETGSSFVSTKTSITLGNTDVAKKHHKVLWKDPAKDPHLPDYPYMVLQISRYECVYGPDRNQAKKEKARFQEKEHGYSKKVFLQSTKKINCPAVLWAKEIMIFPSYKSSAHMTKWKRNQISKAIRESLSTDEKDIKSERLIYIKLPHATDHKYHLQGQVRKADHKRECRRCKVEVCNLAYFQHVQMCTSCALCGQTYGTLDQYKQHIEDCKQQHQPICDQCSKLCKSEKDLNLHKKRFHWSEDMGEPEVYFCKVDGCSFRSNARRNVVRHEKCTHSGKPTMCDLCGSVLKSEYYLKLHIKRTHGALFQCDVCGVKVKDKMALKSHKRRNHDLAPPDFLCSVCSYTAYSKNELQKHMFNKHHVIPPSGNEGFTCPYCGWKIMQKYLMDNHILRHTATERKFPCDKCDKRFVTDQDLKKHQRNHDPGRKRFQCPHCNYSTIHGKSSLRNHVQRLHENKDYKPWVCKECNYRTNLKGNLNSHLRKKHGIAVKTNQHIIMQVKPYTHNNKEENSTSEREHTDDLNKNKEIWPGLGQQLMDIDNPEPLETPCSNPTPEASGSSGQGSTVQNEQTFTDLASLHSANTSTSREDSSAKEVKEYVELSYVDLVFSKGIDNAASVIQTSLEPSSNTGFP